MSCRTSCSRKFSFVLTLVAVAVGLGVPQAAFASGGVDDPSLVFQLEGNVTNESDICFLLNANGAFTLPYTGSCTGGFAHVTFGANTDDWENIAGGSSHAQATSYISPNTTPAEAINSNNDSIFTAGGSKDTLGISSGAWKWKNGKPQAKDDIEHAFAAAYTLPGVVNGSPATCGGTNQPGCDTAVYFGMTRFDNSGAATAGFWFFQDGNVGLAGGTLNANKDPLCSVGSGCSFSGHHSNGDLLIVSDFSQGGPISSIKVYTWSCSGTGAACDSSGSLVASPQAGGECNPTIGSSGLCSIANGGSGLSVPFGFINKSGQSTLANGELLEGGIDLNVIFPNGLPCFSTFMAETRSSNSPTATLSDLTPPVSFPLCGASITKTCTGASYVNDPTTGATTVQYAFSGTVKNTGIGALSNVCVSDTPGANYVANSLSLTQPAECSSGSLAPGATTTYSGTFRTTSASNTEGNTATVNATSAGGTAISPSSASWIVSPATQLPQVCIPSPGSLAITKECKVAVVQVGSVLEIRVDVDGTITNNSGVQVTGLTVTDNPTTSNNSLGSTTLNNGASTTYSGSYFPGVCSTNDNGVCSFSDTVSAQGNGAAGTGTISSNSQGATCHLCPAGVCSTSP
jgi:hypothetical protein